jgi:ATP-dependent protease ClpP protease subunit
MKLFLIALVMFFSPSFALSEVSTEQFNILELKQEQFVKIVGEIEDISASRFIQELYSVSAKSDEVVVYIDSPGGDILSGIRMIDAVNGLRVARSGLRIKCYAQNAASMAFIFMQTSCDHRIVSSYSVLMSHQASLGARGKAGEIETRIQFVRQILNLLDIRVAARLKLSVEEYRKTIVNDWWLVGSNAITSKAADALGSVTCSIDLITASKCPLVFAPPPPAN